jgi:predicted  nucleic acid-binding Zn-ribbon protein
MAVVNFTECPDCGRTVFKKALEEHREKECIGERRTCGMCGEAYADYLEHMTGGCPEAE